MKGAVWHDVPIENRIMVALENDLPEAKLVKFETRRGILEELFLENES